MYVDDSFWPKIDLLYNLTLFKGVMECVCVCVCLGFTMQFEKALIYKG